MRLIKCYVSSFGKLKDYTYDFTDGLNVILQDNGFGKSTLASFIKCMFYGLSDGKRSITQNERLKFKPWGSSDKFGGYVVFETPKGQFRLEKFFGSKASEDEMRLFDNLTGKQLPNVELVGHKLFGIDEEGFASTLYFSEKDLDVKGNSSLTAKYNATLDINADDHTDDALGRIKSLAKEYKYSGERGLIWDSHRKINALALKLAECEKSEQVASELSVRIANLQSELSQLNNEIQKISDKIAVAGKQEAVKVKRERIEYIQEQLAKAKGNYNQANKILNGKNLTESQLEICEKTIDDLRLMNAKAISLSQDLSSLENQKKENAPKFSNKASKIMPLIAGLFSVLGVSFIFALSLIYVGCACLGISFVLLLFFMLSRKAPRNKIFDQQILEKTNSLNEINQVVVQNTSKLKDFFAQFNLQETELNQALEILKQAVKDCERFRAEISEYQEQLNTLSADQDLNLAIDCAENVNLLKNRLSTLNAEYFEKSNKLASYKSDLIMLEKNIEAVSEFENELCEERENKANLEDQLEVLTLTHEFLTRANENQKLRYREPLSQAFNKYVALLDDKTQADIDVDFEVTVDENGSKKQTDYYSKGYKSLFNVCRRFALIDVLYPTNKPFIILDDPFMSLDEDKINKALAMIKEASADYQIIYMVCHDSRV